MVEVYEVVDDASEWNFEIKVNDVLLHSRARLWHGFLCDERYQQDLIRKSIESILPRDSMMGA